MAEGKFVSYVRVSTARQGQSGLGLEAQRTAVEQYLDGGSWSLLKEYCEVESGKRDDRPELEKALAHCRTTGAVLCIAKLDRLSRDAHFLLGLQKAGVRFVAADMPDANNLTVGIMALMAQHEREAISKRTKEALAVAKARGVKLGNPRCRENLRPGAGQERATRAASEAAARRADDLQHVVEEAQAQGATSTRGIAAALNAQSIKTARGGRWHPTSVARLLKRLEAGA